MEKRFINFGKNINKDIIFYFCIFILFYLLDRFSTFTTDDYRYLTIGGMSGGMNGMDMPVKSIKDIIISQIYDYTHVNGRFIVHSITTFFCCFVNIETFRIINSILFIILIRNIDKILAIEGFKLYYNKYIIAFCPFFIFPVTGEVLVGHIATCINYLWVACATTYFILLLHKTYSKHCKWYYNLLLLFTSIIIGSLQESFSIGISGALFVYFCFNYNKFKQSNKYLIIGYWIGTCILVFAPGNFMRFTASESENLFGGIAKYIINAGYLTIASNMLIIMLFSLLVLFIKNRTLLNSIIKENITYILSIIFSGIIVIIVFTGERQLFFIEMVSLIITIKVINSSDFFKNEKNVKFLMELITIYAILMYPFIYSARKDNYSAYTEYQQSEIKDGIMYNNRLLKSTNEIYNNPLLKKFIFPHGYDLHGLSLMRSGGYDRKYIRVVLPYNEEELYKQFCEFNKDGIYHNKVDKFCIIKDQNNLKELKVICYSEPSFMGKIRNFIFKGDNVNKSEVPLDNNYFTYNGEKFYITYESHMETFGYKYEK